VIHQRIHGPQKVLVRDGLGHGRHRHGLQPAQAAEFARGIAQAVEDHRPHQCLGVDLPARRPHRTLQGRVDPQVPPKLMERKDIAEAEPGLLDDLGCGVLDPVEPVDQRFQLLRRDLVEAPKVGHDARADLAAVVSKGLDGRVLKAVEIPWRRALGM
jgi:hypothetical protein